MTIASLQYPLALGSPGENLRQIEDLLSRHPGASLYVLPELFPSGDIAHTPLEIVEAGNRDILSWMQENATKHHAAMAGSVAVSEGGATFNRLYFVEPNGTVTSYDKRHCFTFAHEEEVCRAGTERVVVDYLGVRFLLQVCYDLRFPVWSRNRGDYDVALYVANWPQSRIAAWDVLLKARAIENQCFVVASNRTGHDVTGRYNGHSAIIDPYGRMLAEAGEAETAVIAAQLDLDMLNAFRVKFPVLRDADDFTIHQTK